MIAAWLCDLVAAFERYASQRWTDGSVVRSAADALLENPSLVPSTHTRQFAIPALGDLTPLRPVYIAARTNVLVFLILTQISASGPVSQK